MHFAIFLILLPLTHSSNPVEITPLSDKSGFYLNNLGKLKIIEQHYTLIIYKSILPLYQSIGKIQILLQKIEFIEQNIPERHYTYMHTLTLKSKFAQLNKQLKTIQALLPNKNNAKQRGWINAIGTGLHYVFGLMDTNDETEIKNAINELEKSNKNTLTLVDKSVHLVRDVLRDINTTLANLNTNEIHIDANFMKVQEKINSHSQEITANMFVEQLLNLVIFLDEALNDVSSEIEKIKLQIIYAKTNIIPPSLFENDLYYSSLVDIKNNLPEYNLPFELIRDNLHKLASISKFSIIIDNEQLIYNIKIPIINKNEFTLYHLIPIPTKSGNQPTIVIPNYPYIGVERLSKQYIPLNTLSMVNEQYGDFFVYDPTIRNHEDASCEAEVCLTGTWSQKCQPIPINFEAEEIHRLNSNQWIVLLAKPSNLSYKCQNQEIKSDSIQHSSIITLHAPCSGLIANMFRFSLFKHDSTTKNVTGSVVTIPDDCCIREIDVSKPLLLNHIPLHGLNDDNTVLHRHRLEQLHEEISHEIHRPWKHILPTNWWQLLLTAIVPLALFCCCCYCCCPGCLRLIKPRWPGNSSCLDKCITIWNVQNNAEKRHWPSPSRGRYEAATAHFSQRLPITASPPTSLPPTLQTPGDSDDDTSATTYRWRDSWQRK